MIMARKKISESKVWWKNVKDLGQFDFRVVFGRNMCDPNKEPYEFETEEEFQQAMDFWNISDHRYYRRWAVIKNISTENALKYELSEKKRLDTEYKEAINLSKRCTEKEARR